MAFIVIFGLVCYVLVWTVEYPVLAQIVTFYKITKVISFKVPDAGIEFWLPPICMA